MPPKRCPNLDEVRKKHGNRADKLAGCFLQGDPLADELVALFSQLPPGRGSRMLDLALEQGIEAVPQAPKPLLDFFAQVDDVPLWLDWDLLELGSRTFMRCGCLGGIVLGCSALPLAYLSASASKPLVFSRQFFERAIRRLSETNRFFFEACKPGGLRRHSPGWKITIKVRLMHAQMRRLLRQSKTKPWQQDHWGVPINQLDMAVACLLFSVSQLRHLRLVGFHFSTLESEGVMHLWQYCGYLLGIAPDLLCATEATGRQLERMLFDVYDGPDQDSVRLTRALMENAMPILLAAILPWILPAGESPGRDKPRGQLTRLRHHLLRQLGRRIPRKTFRRQLTRFCYGLSHAILGGRIASQLEYPGTTWRHTAPLLLRALVTPVEVLRRLFPGGTTMAFWAGHEQLERLMQIEVFARHPLFLELAGPSTDAPSAGSSAGDPPHGK